MLSLADSQSQERPTPSPALGWAEIHVTSRPSTSTSNTWFRRAVPLPLWGVIGTLPWSFRLCPSLAGGQCEGDQSGEGESGKSGLHWSFSMGVVSDPGYDSLPNTPEASAALVRFAQLGTPARTRSVRRGPWTATTCCPPSGVTCWNAWVAWRRPARSSRGRPSSPATRANATSCWNAREGEPSAVGRRVWRGRRGTGRLAA